MYLTLFACINGQFDHCSFFASLAASSVLGAIISAGIFGFGSGGREVKVEEMGM